MNILLHVRFSIFILLISIAQYSSISIAEEGEWANLYGCVNVHRYDVARHIISLEEGAKLIVQSLCNKESTTLANVLTSTRNEDIGEGAIGRRFEIYIGVIEREVRLILYKTKILQ